MAVLNIAHRGARSLAPENTLAAARKALEIGSEMWELDVGVTADGELYLMHDDTLVRTTNVQTVFPERAPWGRSDLSLAEIRRLEAGSFFVRDDPFGQIAVGKVCAEELEAMAVESIPTLREALLFTRDHSWRVNVEIKMLPPHMAGFPVVERALALFQALDMVEQVVLSSFVHSYLQQAKRLNPAISTAVLTEEPQADPAALLRALESKIYHPWLKITSVTEIQSLCQADFEVNVWTVNDTTEMEWLIQAGVQGIITDFPQWLKEKVGKNDEG
jgi:glycerophosphoryl diester phosphodiesterase